MQRKHWLAGALAALVCAVTVARGVGGGIGSPAEGAVAGAPSVSGTKLAANASRSKRSPGSAIAPSSAPIGTVVPGST